VAEGEAYILLRDIWASGIAVDAMQVKQARGLGQFQVKSCLAEWSVATQIILPPRLTILDAPKKLQLTLAS
jgi:hypothetical protein